MAGLAYVSVEKLTEMLRTAGGGRNRYVRIIDTTRLGVGDDPLNPAMFIDLSSEKIVAAKRVDASVAIAPLLPAEQQREIIGRRSGDYWFEFEGHRHQCGSLREMLKGVLLLLERKHAGTWDALSLLRNRSKRIVASNPGDLFTAPHLQEKYAAPLAPGWWFGTNNSAAETLSWIRRAAECAGLRVGRELKVSLT